MKFRHFMKKWFSLESRTPRELFAMISIYYFFLIILLFFLPFSPAFIPFAYIPIVHISIISDYMYGILANFLFIVISYIYVLLGYNYKIPSLEYKFLLSSIVFTVLVMLMINHFTRLYDEKRKKIAKSMEQLAVSYENLEVTQTKLFSLTEITRALLTVKNKDKLISELIKYLNRYMLYRDIIYFNFKDNEYFIQEKLGCEDIDELDLLDYINNMLRINKEVHIFSRDEFANGQICPYSRIMLAPIYKNEKSRGILLTCHDNDWLHKEDRDIMAILVDQLGLIFDKIELIEDTKQMAITDVGTKLYNQRFFFDHLEKRFEISRDKNFPLSVVIFDVDNFKEINDNYGHLTGDRVLEELADLLITNIREEDVLARYGGDEFALILPDTGQETAYKISKRMVAQISDYVFKTNDDKIIKASISGGVANYPECRVENHVNLVECADKALYQSKEKGRNTVTLRACNYT